MIKNVAHAVTRLL